MSGWIAAIVWIFTLGLGGPVYLQYNLNQVWEKEPVVPPALAAGGAAGNADLERIKTLTELRESGAISEEEFEREKARVLPAARSQASEPEPS